MKTKAEIGWDTPDKFEIKHTVAKDGQKVSEWDISYDKKTGKTEVELTTKDRSFEFKADNINDFRSVQWGLKYGQKSYKMSAVRVPKESIALKLDSSENSRLKEVLTLSLSLHKLIAGLVQSKNIPQREVYFKTGDE